MRYDTILFDLDGTLTDSGEGIMKSAAYALEETGRKAPGPDVLRRFVGPPLLASFIEYGDMSEEEARRAITAYRERYDRVGWRENRVYAGIAQMLSDLKRCGAYIAVATGKPEHFAVRIMKYFGLMPYLDKVVGIHEETGSADKCDLIRAALPEKYDPARTVVIGDRRFDIESAKQMGLCAVGVLYGYGSSKELGACGANALCSSVDVLHSFLLAGDKRGPGRFITFEGADGCGKSTQMDMLKLYLSSRGWAFQSSREPGGCPASERVRELVLNNDYKGMSDPCEALLFAAARVEHVRQVIAPAVKDGKIMLCDRFLDSSFAYQAYGRELGEEFIRQINRYAYEIVPDLTLLFVGKRETVTERLMKSGNLDRIESEQDAFVERVYEGYRRIQAADPKRVHIIDSDRSIDEIFEDVKREVEALLKA